MKNRIRIAVVGYGNIGKAVVEAIEASPDLELAGIVRRSESLTQSTKELKDITVVDDIQKLDGVQVAILCTPTRQMSETARKILALGINTVDSYDIHGSIWELRQELEKIAQENNVVAIVSAGWDPGSDSVIRSLMEAVAPKGITYTNFGPGMSMGHTTAVKSIAGVKNALSITIPLGTGIHRRMVYVEIEAGADFNEIAKNIKSDTYFIKDETHVFQVDSVDDLKDMGHGKPGAQGRIRKNPKSAI